MNPIEKSDGASMATGLGPAGACQAPHTAAGPIRARMSVLVTAAALVFPPFGFWAVGLLRAASRAAAVGDSAGVASALRRARHRALAAFAAAVLLAVPVGSYLWGEATATCVCMSPTFERD